MHRVLAVAAALAGLLAPLARGHAPADRGERQVAPLELAAWIRGREPGLRVLDLRAAVEAELVRLPRAERVPADGLDAGRFRADELLVLVSGDGGGAAPEAWARLRARGHLRVRVLEGGADRWVDDVLSPTLAPDASPEAVAAFRRTSELSRYFGGVPRVLAPGEAGPRPAGGARHVVVRGRGC